MAGNGRNAREARQGAGKAEGGHGDPVLWRHELGNWIIFDKRAHGTWGNHAKNDIE